MKAHIESINAAYSALNNGDVEGFIKDFHADIVRMEFFDGFPDAGDHRGLDAVKAHVLEGRSTWAEGACKVEELIISGDMIVVNVHVRVRLQNQTDWIDGRVTDVFTFRSGKIVEFYSFTDRERAYEYSGLSAQTEG